MTMKEAMADYWARSPESRRTTCDFEDVDPVIFTSEPDEAGYVRWDPKEKPADDFSHLEKRLGQPLHSWTMLPGRS